MVAVLGCEMGIGACPSCLLCTSIYESNQNFLESCYMEVCSLGAFLGQLMQISGLCLLCIKAYNTFLIDSNCTPLFTPPMLKCLVPIACL